MDREDSSKIEVGVGGRVRGRTFFVPYFVLCVCLSLTLISTLLFYFGAHGRDVTRYNTGVSRITNSIEGRIGLHMAILQATKGFVDAHSAHNGEHLEAFVQSLDLEKGYTGIQGIGYTHIFRRSERDALIARMRAEGYKDFLPYPDSARETKQAIIYLFPRNERNRRAIGYDMSSEETRRIAIERARDEGRPALSGRVTLVQEITEDKQAGFLIYLPIYEGGAMPDTVETRRQAIKGFVYAPFRAGNFFREIERVVGSDDIAFEIYDVSVQPENLLSRSAASREAVTDGEDLWSFFSSTAEIEVAGRQWTVLYSTRPSFSDQSIIWWTPLIFISGILLSVILYFMTRRQASSREELRSIAVELLVSEREKQALFEKEQEARVEAEKGNVAKDEFISVVSHELRTPLNAIAGWTRVLRGPDVSSIMRTSALDKIERNLKMQSALVEDLLTFSQLESQKFQIDRETVDISSAVRSVISELEPLSAEKQVTILLEDEVGSVTTPGDAEKLRLCIMKLVSNSLKFTPFGGEVQIQIVALRDSVQIRVKDNGQGIRPEFLPYVFERFKQNDSSTTRKFAGLGLGLTIAERIIDLHGGNISASSEGEGKGAEFTIRLPR